MAYIAWNDDEGEPEILSADDHDIVMQVGCQRVSVSRASLLELAKTLNKDPDFKPGWCWASNLDWSGEGNNMRFSLGPIYGSTLSKLASRMEWRVDGRCYLIDEDDETEDFAYNDNDFHPYFVATLDEAKLLFPRVYR